MYRLLIPLVLCVTFGPVAHGQTDAARVLIESRQALGGDSSLSAVRAFAASGHVTRVALRGLQLRSDLDIVAVLPERYIRKERLAAGPRSVDTALGFSRHTLIRATPMIAAPSAATGAGPDPRRALDSGALLLARQEFGLLALGLFATAFEGYPLGFTFAGRAESPAGTADVIDVSGEALTGARLFIDATTRLPRMVSWQGADVRLSTLQAMAPTSTTGREFSQNEIQDQMARSRATVEYRLYFSDYRPVDGLQWPFRLRRSIAGETIEEWELERFHLNPTIDEKAFQVSR